MSEVPVVIRKLFSCLPCRVFWMALHCRCPRALPAQGSLDFTPTPPSGKQLIPLGTAWTAGVGLCSILGSSSCSLWQGGCGTPRGCSAPQGRLLCPSAATHEARPPAFCANRNPGAGELGLGSNSQSRNRLYLLLNLLLTQEPSLDKRLKRDSVCNQRSRCWR